MKTRAALLLIIILSIVGILIAYFSIDEESLPPEEAAQIRDACGNCHRNPNRLTTDNIHQNHRGMNCTTCHFNNTELESAEETHDSIFWIGIGIAGLTVTGLAINFAVARKRLSGGAQDENS